MHIQQLYTDCLAEAAYYIESQGDAVIIDPMRDIDQYLEIAERRGSRIKYILETHFHADFVSGHVDLASRTGAQIVYGPLAAPKFDAKIATDGEVLEVGDLRIKVLHTPGHTMESTTYLLLDANGKEHAIFSGDTLFIGDVGRPDLAVKTDLTSEDLAGHLFDSLRNKIMPLPDDVIVYPAHGAGSACGKNMSSETFDTLGNQKRLNYALDPKLTREDFITQLTTGLAAPPQYFPKNAVLNQIGYDSLEKIQQQGHKALGADEFEALRSNENYLVLDTRHQSEFAKAHIPGSVFIGIDGSFASWVGSLIPNLETPILIVSEEGREEEVITRLSRVGYDNPKGFLKGGVEAWIDAGKTVSVLKEIDAEGLSSNFGSLGSGIVDVRKPSEWNDEHIKGVPNVPLSNVEERQGEFDPGQEYYLHCKSGYRSVIAASLLKKNGVENVVNVLGGFEALKQTDIPMTKLTEELA